MELSPTDDPQVPPDELAAFGSSVARFAGTSLRDLPWRHTRDPWHVLVAEAMLQQTQVARVIEPYRRLVERFPSPSACAAAPVGEVVRAWAGLGYNRRAVHLHRSATVLVERHGGEVPARLAELLTLPGVGAYTARAVLAFAFDEDVGVLDTNVARVLARAVAGRPLGPAAAQALADRLVPTGRGWSHNQAMLDLGALHCTARRPGCSRCPVRRRCRWTLAGSPLPDPALGSAATSRPQSRFAGSERQGRGRLVAALRRGPVTEASLAAAAGWPDDPHRAQRAAEALVAEGMARWEGGTLTLG